MLPKLRPEMRLAGKIIDINLDEQCLIFYNLTVSL